VVIRSIWSNCPGTHHAGTSRSRKRLNIQTSKLWKTGSDVVFCVWPLWSYIHGCNFSVGGWNRQYDQSAEGNQVALSCNTVYYAMQRLFHLLVQWMKPSVTIQMKLSEKQFPCFIRCFSTVERMDKILEGWPFKWKLLSSTFLWCCLLCCTRWF